MASQSRNWKMTVSYDGTDFKGWQVQPGERTVQGELQAALGSIAGETPLPQGSGRTDAGVHALAQVASFALNAPVPAANLQRALNRILPPSIRILAVEAAPPEFHARHAAVAKTYEYRIFRGAICPPFVSRFVHVCRWPLNLQIMREAAESVMGSHDFISFAASDSDLSLRSRAASDGETGMTVRTIYLSRWEERESEAGSLLIYRVRGNGFLHHMVRNLVGTMLEIGRGQLPAGAMAGILKQRARSAAGPTAPARGLFLHSVEYEKL